MERSLSVDEKIRRAEEIYNRRNSTYERKTATVNVGTQKSKIKLKKMLIQVFICVLIYIIYYLITTTNYIFSDSVINKTKEILNKDINFIEIYNNILEFNNSKDEITEVNSVIENNESSEVVEMVDENANNVQEEKKDTGEEINTEENTLSVSEENTLIEETSSFNQMDMDAKDIISGYSLIKPLNGTITSRYGVRNPTTESVPKYHTGIDIAANEGTEIIASMDGIVNVVSTEGDYRQSHKNIK